MPYREIGSSIEEFFNELRLLVTTIPFARTFPTLAIHPNTSNNINKLLTSSNMYKITSSSLPIDWNCFMSVTLEELDPERQQKAREYARIRHRLLLVDLGIATVGIVIVLFSGIGIWLRDALHPLGWQPIAGWFPWQVLLYFLALMLSYQVISAPLTYYSSYILPHRYGLSTLSLKNWLLDLFKGLALSLVFEAFVVELVYLLLATQPQTWWLWVAAVLLFFSVVMANLAPVLILPLFYKFSRLPEGELAQRLLALAERAHTRVRGVFTMHLSSKTTAANATNWDTMSTGTCGSSLSANHC